MIVQIRLTTSVLVLSTMLSSAWVMAADLPMPKATPGRVMLPQTYQYQRVLRQYMGTLQAADFEHGVTEELGVRESSQDPDYQYRMLIMTLMMQPLVGFKRGIPAVNAPAHNFVLSTIEGPETAPKPEPMPVPKKPRRKLGPGPIRQPAGIVRPPTWPDALVAFAAWDYPGNTFKDNKALKLRAFVTAAVRMIMLDDFLDRTPGQHRADWNAYRLVTFSRSYEGVEDVLPKDVQEAFKAGILRFGKRVLSWGVKGELPESDANGPIGLLYASRVCGDQAFTQAAEAEARKMFTDPTRFNPAGYWVERGGGLDIAFGGMSNLYAVWIALMTDWDVARDAVDRLYRLRAHLSLPDPDGVLEGPSHFNSRIGSPASTDQWHWNGVRDRGAAMITDEAAHILPTPTAEELAGAAAKRARTTRGHIYGHLRNPYHRNKKFGYVPNDEIRGATWKWRVWDTYNFPLTINPVYEFYEKGALARLQKLQKANSPMLKSPYLRDGAFLKEFGKAFVATKQPGFAAILHLGPVGILPKNDGNFQWKGPLGFGGGQLSAFWTKESGSVIMGRRAGMGWDKCRDDIANWRLWPLHAVCGSTEEGKVFTTARIARPTVVSEFNGQRGTAEVSGPIPAAMLGQGQVLKGRLDYTRTFTIGPDGVKIKTTLNGDGKDTVAELYEVLPVFMRGDKPQIQAKVPFTKIAFGVDGQYQPATPDWQEAVTAVRLSRFKGAVDVRFDSPQRIKLSADKWHDTYLTRASCQNILIDLLGSNDQPAAITDAKTVSYTIAPAAK